MRCHLQPLAVGRRTAADYAPIVGAEALERLHAAAAPVKGARIAHITAAGSRLRALEALPALISLYRDLGIEAELLALAGDRPLWRLVRQLEDGLQGGETAIDDEQWSAYRDAAPTLDRFDAVVVHGPGPLAVQGRVRVWRCELDCSNADAESADRVLPLLNEYTAVAAPAKSYAPPGIDAVELHEAIDPLAPGSVDLPVRLAGSMLRAAGVDLTRPCCCQIRPFDSWQDPHGVLDAFELAREQAPELQLVLAGDPARGDIEAWRLLREVSEYADRQRDVLLLTGPGGLGTVELNALKTIARAALESALVRGSVVGALEVLWKGTPVITADSPEAMAERLVELVRDPGLAIELGSAGRELVREKHLITRLAEEELKLLAKAIAGDAATLQSG